MQSRRQRDRDKHLLNQRRRIAFPTIAATARCPAQRTPCHNGWSFAVRSTLDPTLLRRAVRRGAASCRAVPRSCPVTAAAGVVTAEPSWIAQRRRRCNPSEVRAAQPAVAVAVAVQDVRTPATAVVAGSASAVRHADGRPSNWSGGRLCPGDRCPRDRGDPGCPDGQASGVHSRCSRAVRTVLDPRIRRCGGTGHIGAPGWTCRCGRCAAWSSLPERAWREGMVERWPCVARTRIDARPGLPLGMRTGCGAALAARRPWELVQRRCRSVGGGAGEGAGAPSPPQVRPGQVAGVLADHGAGTGRARTVVGATGFEPVTPSVSAKPREPLCKAPFSQVTADRRPEGKRSLDVQLNALLSALPRRR
jgi:hypothetical protein